MPRFGIDLARDNISLVKEAGFDIVRDYPVNWHAIELYKPGSKKIKSSLVKDPKHQEILKDEKGILHFFDWSRTDRTAELFCGSQSGGEFEVFFSIHETNWWSMSRSERKYDLKRGRNLKRDWYYPLKDQAAVEHFKFFVKRFVERYDNDGVDDMSNLRKPVNYWQLGAEYNSLFWKGSADEYLIGWKAFADSVRSANPNALIVANGLSFVPHEPLPKDNAGKIFTRLYKKYELQKSRNKTSVKFKLTDEEESRARTTTRNPNKYLTSDDIIKQMGFNKDDPRSEYLIYKIDWGKRFEEFMNLIFDHPELYDIYDPRIYTYFKYEPDRIVQDITFVKEQFSIRGYTKPIMPTEGSGAHLHGKKFEKYLKLIENYLIKRVYSNNTEMPSSDEEKVFQLYLAEQAREVVKVLATSFSEGISSFVWWKMFDTPLVTKKNIDKASDFHSAFKIEGLVLNIKGKLIRKPSFYTFKIMIENLRDFVSAQARDKGQVKFTFKNKSPVYVLWTEDSPKNVDLSKHISSKNVKITHIVTSLNRHNEPIRKADEIASAKNLTVSNTPIFVQEY